MSCKNCRIMCQRKEKEFGRHVKTFSLVSFFFCWIDFYRNKFFNRYFLLYNKKICDSLEKRNYKGCTLYICFHISDYVLKLCVEIFFFLTHHHILHIVYSLYYTNFSKNAFFSQQCLQSQFTTVEKDISGNTRHNKII